MLNFAITAIALAGWIVAGGLWLARRDRSRSRQAPKERDDTGGHDAVLTMIAHELRTPLTAMLGYAEIAGQPSLDAEHRKRCLDRVLGQGRHLLRLLNDVFDFVRLREGRLQAHQIDVEIAALVRDLERDVRPAAEAKGLLLDIRVEPGVPSRLAIDPDRVLQITRTLLHNGVKFTRRGNVSAAFGLVGDGRLRITVSDTGPGIRSEVQASLFARLGAGDRSHRRRHAGVGLGLALVGRLVELLGGMARVDSNAGSGTRIEVDLPFRPAGVRDPMLAPSPPPADRNAPALAGSDPAANQVRFDGQVLLVDDSRDNQVLIRHVLRRFGLHADVAENGRVALRALDRSRYDLVLMDMQMPVLDGYAATRQLRARGDETPVVALTAHALSGDREKCLASGCDDFLTKPLDRAALEGVLERYLAAREANATHPTSPG